MRRTQSGKIICWIVYISAIIMFGLDIFGIPLIDYFGAGVIISLFLITYIYLFGFKD